MTDRTDPPTRPQRTLPGRPDLRPPALPATDLAMSPLDYRAEITLLILVVGGLVARALGSDELAIALVAGALGYAQRNGVTSRVAKTATAAVFVVAVGASLLGCGAGTGPAVKAILDGAAWSCGIIEPVCDAATLACGFVPGSPRRALSSGGEVPVVVAPSSSEFTEP